MQLTKSRLLIKRSMSSILQQQPSNISAFTTSMPLILIDFDQTITLHDSIAALGQFGISQTNISKNWSYFTDEYLKDYGEHKQQLPKNSNLEYKTFIGQLNSYRPIENASIARINLHKVFGGIHRQAFYQAGQDLCLKEIRPGVMDVLKHYKDQIRIVSLNWSKDWILGFLKELDLKREQIYSNDLIFASDDCCTGEIMPQILTTGDKQQIIKTFKSTAKVLYIGDSLGDIEPLVESDIGIVIGKDKSLLDALNQFGYKVQNNIESQNDNLYRVDNWDQIKTILNKRILK